MFLFATAALKQDYLPPLHAIYSRMAYVLGHSPSTGVFDFVPVQEVKEEFQEEVQAEVPLTRPWPSASGAAMKCRLRRVVGSVKRLRGKQSVGAPAPSGHARLAAAAREAYRPEEEQVFASEKPPWFRSDGERAAAVKRRVEDFDDLNWEAGTHTARTAGRNKKLRTFFWCKRCDFTCFNLESVDSHSGKIAGARKICPNLQR